MSGTDLCDSYIKLNNTYRKEKTSSLGVFCIPSVSRGLKQQSGKCSDGEGVVLCCVVLQCFFCFFYSSVRKDAFDHPLLNTCLPDKTRKRDDL